MSPLGFEPAVRPAVLILLWASMLLASVPSHADEVRIIRVDLTRQSIDRFRVDVTLEHADEGWEHYADGWVVVDENGKTLGERPLAHPHVDEQPFTRSLTIPIAPTIETVRVRAHDSVHGPSALSAPVSVPRAP